MNEQKINGLIEKRNKLLQRRDGLYDHERVNRIDAKLSAAVAPGQRQDVDLLLGRVLPKSAAIHDPASPRETLARQQRAEMDDETILTNWPLSAAACQIRRERSQAVTRWSSDDEREASKAHGEAEAARLAAEKRSAFDIEMRRLCADYDIEAPTYDGMWK